MTPDQEAKLTAFLVTAQAQSTKMDGLLAGLNQLVPQVSDNKSSIRFLRSQDSAKGEKLARHDERISNLVGDVDSIGSGVRKHVGNSSLHRSAADAFTDGTVRWKFVGAVTAAIGSIVALVILFAKFYPG